MKRFHLHIGVDNLEKSVQFYSNLFGQEPTKLKVDYAKWLLDDPKINFAISTRVSTKGVDHLGIQVDEGSELSEITERLKKAGLGISDQGETTCCYAKSNKAWVQDQNGIAWEAYQNMGDAEIFSEKDEVKTLNESTCCPAKSNGEKLAKTGCC